MSIKFLNTIIAISMTGLIFIGVHDYISPKTPAVIMIPSVAPTQTAIASQDYRPQILAVTGNPDPDLICSSQYFNFNPGAKWQYKIIGQFETNQDNVKKTQKFNQTFTNVIENNASYSASIKTSYSEKGKNKTSEINCRKSGIYGFPLPILDDLSTSSSGGQLSILSNVKIKPLLFLPPDDKLTLGGTWKTALDIDSNLSIPLGALGLGLTNKVIKEEKINFNSQMRTQLTVETKLNSALPIDLLGGAEMIKLRYILLENVGIKEFDINLNINGIISASIKINLVNFNP
ncbi:hypothetical protein A3C23_05210 [Candidatus Roizmanbacteria bacterium RIFCSPHIGHO2_02_FULL_37_13b]|uniref:Uncharacterized protein n=1 Tax=Candidatus Roizmanbacteria bacterium RIFCSPLOWO2_02_FULL_36_11 TaxID=1802071 RepID=A0A1F7JCP4_9BACT|nr:MAG: hypothetical protein A3C23_05210 [Candidatus Roizmanbacteria bacterium RIFCSPHIGHO2_02_FULL_37_13b]OGK53355.1 MAG: hypothetical protein A3H78_03580 [Candidatus Roizmanbacteria bacterium RIFCSPLOWO2_02_FULL_36_11]